MFIEYVFSLIFLLYIVQGTLGGRWDREVRMRVVCCHQVDERRNHRGRARLVMAQMREIQEDLLGIAPIEANLHRGYR